MKQPFAFKIENVIEVMYYYYGFSSIDLSDEKKVHDTITNLIHLLNINQYVFVSDASSDTYQRTCFFSLEARENVMTDAYIQAITKFQNLMKFKLKDASEEAQRLINEIDAVIAKIPRDKYQPVIRTTKHYENTLIKDYLPSMHWYFSPSVMKVTDEVVAYYNRKGFYQSSESGVNILLYVEESDEYFSEKKRLEKAKSKKKTQVSTLITLIVFCLLIIVVAYLVKMI